MANARKGAPYFTDVVADPVRKDHHDIGVFSLRDRSALGRFTEEFDRARQSRAGGAADEETFCASRCRSQGRVECITTAGRT